MFVIGRTFSYKGFSLSCALQIFILELQISVVTCLSSVRSEGSSIISHGSEFVLSLPQTPTCSNSTIHCRDPMMATASSDEPTTSSSFPKFPPPAYRNPMPYMVPRNSVVANASFKSTTIPKICYGRPARMAVEVFQKS